VSPKAPRRAAGPATRAGDRARRPPASLGKRRLAARTVRGLFRLIVPQRAWELPGLPQVVPFAATARDGVALRGWAMRPPGARAGTVLILHGLLRNCTLDGIPEWGQRFAANGWASAAIDLRHHGRSGDAIPTFGLHESWDARAALDELERRGFPGPFIVMGGSLGALTAQRAAFDDARIAGAVLIAMPAWPWHGAVVGGEAIAGLARDELAKRAPRWLSAPLGPLLLAVGRQARLIGELIATANGRDVLADGDVRRYGGMPAHRPLLLSLIGSLDQFDWRATYLAWRAWPGGPAVPLLTPARAPAQRRWFVLVPGHGHPPDPDSVLAWPGLPTLLDEFLGAVGADRR
jgi:pimeloyl-ACP methyl ester carboxylesterase